MKEEKYKLKIRIRMLFHKLKRRNLAKFARLLELNQGKVVELLIFRLSVNRDFRRWKSEGRSERLNVLMNTVKKYTTRKKDFKDI